MQRHPLPECQKAENISPPTQQQKQNKQEKKTKMDSMNFVEVALVWHESSSVMQEHLRWRHVGMSTMRTPTRNYINLPVILKGQKLDVLLDILNYVLDQ